MAAVVLGGGDVAHLVAEAEPVGAVDVAGETDGLGGVVGGAADDGDGDRAGQLEEGGFGGVGPRRGPMGQRATMTFPRAWPCSWYLMAAGICSKG